MSRISNKQLLAGYNQASLEDKDIYLKLLYNDTVRTSNGTAEGLVDSFPSGFQAARDAAGSMIVSYSMGVNLPSARWRRFRW